MVYLRISAFLLISSLGLGSCSTTGTGKLEQVQPLPKEVPQELQKKFEVKELTQESFPSQPSPTPSPTPSVALKAKKGKKPAALPKETAKAADQPVKTFVYPSRRPERDPVWIGEKMTLEMTFFGMVAGDMSMEVLPFKVVNDRKVYHLKGNAASSKMFNLFYKVNDSIESYYDYDGLFSHRFHMLLDQSRQSRDSVELFDSEKKQVYYWSRKNHVEKGFSEVKEYKDIPAFPQDSFSALYHVRSLPLEVGKQYVVPVVSEGKSWEAVIKVLRKEVLDTPLGKISTLVLKPEHRFDGVLKKKGDSFIWLSDDDRRFIVRIEANVKIGTVVGRLKSVEKGEPPQ